MATTKHLWGGLIGVFVGALLMPAAATIAMLLFYKGGGFVVDFAPVIILFLAVIWGAFSGTIFGLMLLGRREALIAGLLLPIFLLLLLFLANVFERGFRMTADIWYGDGIFSSSFVGPVCFVALTILTSYVISIVNDSPKKTTDIGQQFKDTEKKEGL